jgi:hypothetical protein
MKGTKTFRDRDANPMATSALESANTYKEQLTWFARPEQRNSSADSKSVVIPLSGGSCSVNQ